MNKGIRLEVEYLRSEFKFEEEELNRLLKGRNGGVAADLSKRAIRVEGRAKRNASGRPGPNVQTGRLRSSITWRLSEDGEGLFADIGTNVNYAPFVEKKYPFLAPALEAARSAT